VVVKPIRHVLHVADLTASESAELGPLLTRVSGTVSALLNPEQVYVCLWSHAGGIPRHIHFVVQPADAEAVSEHDAYGPDLQVAMFKTGVLPSRGQVEEFCEQMRIRLV
jgi:diadenosine tetraphosphate (Ap4A) HIT family hydrolase